MTMHYELWTMSQNLSLSAHLVRWEEGREAREERANMTMAASSSFSLGFCKLMCWEYFLCAFLQVELHFFELLFHHMRPDSHLSSPAVKYMFWLATVLPKSWNEQAKKIGPYRCARCAVQCPPLTWLCLRFTFYGTVESWACEFPHIVNIIGFCTFHSRPLSCSPRKAEEGRGWAGDWSEVEYAETT